MPCSRSMHRLRWTLSIFIHEYKRLITSTMGLIKLETSHITEDVLCLCTEFSGMLLFWFRWNANEPTVLFSVISLVSELQFIFRCSLPDDEYINVGFWGWLPFLLLNENPLREIYTI
jgi:hypothetical protein